MVFIYCLEKTDFVGAEADTVKPPVTVAQTAERQIFDGTR